MKQDQALALMQQGHNIFLTGMAGTGKSYLLNTFIAWCEEHSKYVSITASTGIAATHIGGVTIHSWGGLGIYSQNDLTDAALNEICRNPYTQTAIRETAVLIIDEISMLHAYQLDGLDYICSTIRKDPRPFGGIQIILSGDFLQIPPVSTNNNVTYAFDSTIWDKANLITCYLEDIFRQDDLEFIQILNQVRYGDVRTESFNTLAACINKQLDIEDPTELYPRNKEVEYINTQKLNKIDKPEVVYKMTVRGREALVNSLKRSCISPEILVLKEGAHVIFTKNNFKAGFSNGTFGTVIKCEEGRHPIVKLTSNKEIEVEKAVWEIKKFNFTKQTYEIEAAVSQIPLKLAYALTAHKSQGTTLEYAKINLANLFSYNMGYVALSRVKSLKNLTLVALDHSLYLVDPVLLNKDKEFKAADKTNLEIKYEL